MRINHNIASLNTYRQLTQNSFNTQKSLEKLSSGLRINRAGDDAAGLAISEKMRGQIRGLEQASRNAQDAISLIQTAEGALNETHSILQRMRELAVQSANDTATDTDRAEIQKEIDQLVSEIDRIGNTTEFNTKSLLNGNVGSKLTASVSGLQGVSTSAKTESGVYNVDIQTVATQATITGGDFAGGVSGTFTVNGTNITINTTDSIGDVASKINNVTASTGVIAVIQEGSTSSDTKLVLQTLEYGSDATISITGSSASLFQTLGFGSGTDVTKSAAGTDVAGTIEGAPAVGKGLELTSKGANSEGLVVKTKVDEQAATTTVAFTQDANDSHNLTINGTTVTIAINDDIDTVITKINAVTKDTGVTATKSGSNIVFSSVAKGVNAEISITDTNNNDSTSGDGSLLFGNATVSATGSNGLSTTTQDGNITVNKDNVLKTHIGANEGQTMEIDINDMRASALGVDNIDVTTQSGAESAITAINDAIEKVSAERSKLGAFQNRLEHTINNLGTSAENLTASESRIRDVDMAKEMMEFTKNNILSQAAQAMLAQANQQPQGVLQLLR